MPNIAPDSAAHHAWLTSLVELPTSGVVLDLGCGGGYDLMTLAQRATTPDVTFLGVDRSAKAIEKAKTQSPATAGVRFEAVDLTATLPWEDGSIDVVFSNNYLECVEDAAGFVGEVARIVRPGGQVVFAHWDWDTQVFNAKDKARVRRLVHAFADWQQAWMDYSDGWMGRRLWGTFQTNGSFDGTVHARTMVNTEYRQPWYGYARAQDFRSLVKRDLASAVDVEAFLGEQEAMASAGQYCYSITGYAYVGRRNPTHT